MQVLITMVKYICVFKLYFFTNLVATHHYSCTSPMDYNSHHSLHYDTHIPIHHCTNHTAVINHSLTLIVSPHLHLIHTHTHISSTLPCTHREVLFCPGWHFWAFPLYSVSLDCLYTLTVCCLPFDPACLSISSLSAACPDLCIAPVADSVLPTWHLLLPLTLACLTLPCCSLKLHLDLNASDSSCYIFIVKFFWVM